MVRILIVVSTYVHFIHGSPIWLFLHDITIGNETYTNVFPDAEPDIYGTVYDVFPAAFDPQVRLYSRPSVGGVSATGLAGR